MTSAPDLQRLTDERLDELTASGQSYVHLIAIATKPDIIKQAPIYAELVRRGESVIVCHTDQHYDPAYSRKMLEEFGMPVDVHFGIDGTLGVKGAQIIERIGGVLAQLTERGLTPVPYVHGDTLTSMAVAVGSYLHRVACVHVEAGIRTVTPKAEVYDRFLAAYDLGTFDWAEYLVAMRDESQFELGSMEPFPEQFNTRVSDAGSGYHAAPVELARRNLLNEGFPASTIEVVGNTVVDATAAAVRDSAQATIFDTYPQLQSGEFIRFCIHRRENTESEPRFRVLFDAMEELVREGRSVLLISLFATESAIDGYGLRDRLAALVDEYPASFIYSSVWPYYRDVIAAMLACSLVATDSGSMQEEMNILGVPCVTLRFGTDRGESIFAGGNVLAPPVDSGFVAEVIRRAADEPRMRGVGNIYGEDASRRLVSGVLARLEPGLGVFLTEEARLGLTRRVAGGVSL